MFCIHKYGKVQEDDYQYCTKCNKAISVSCLHKWDTVSKYKNTIISIYNRKENMEYHLRCINCGIVKKIVL